MESHFAHDFSRVRVHTDARAAQSAAAINASAYTVGRDIVFGSGAYAPQGAHGKRLLAHELAHVVQQSAAEPAAGAALTIAGPTEAPEIEAERAAQSLTASDSFDIVERCAPRIFRQGPPAAQPVAPPVACIQPINFTLHAGSDSGVQDIQMSITWESSTGVPADLSNCQVQEVVTYDPIPNPPFIWSPNNPTILGGPASACAGGDTHSYSPGLNNGISRPRVAGTAISRQVYQFRCTGPGCSGAWTDFPNHQYTITREVFAQYFRLNPWRYRITKAGVNNLYFYSREVEVPL